MKSIDTAFMNATREVRRYEQVPLERMLGIEARYV
jgi:hypothetical protein